MRLYVKLLIIFFLPQAMALPVISDDTSKEAAQWQTLSPEEFQLEIDYHTQRVEYLSKYLMSHLRSLSVNKQALKALVAQHDSTKMIPKNFEALYKAYQSPASQQLKDQIEQMNYEEHRSQLEILKNLGLFENGAIDKGALRALSLIELADMLDRSMYPKTLAKQVYNIESKKVTSPEFGRVMQPAYTYLDLRKFVVDHYLAESEKDIVKMTARLRQLLRKAEAQYDKEMQKSKLIPAYIYQKSCRSFFL